MGFGGGHHTGEGRIVCYGAQELVSYRRLGLGGGGSKTYRTLGGGELAPKVVLGKLGLFDPQTKIFYRISVEKVQIQGPPKTQNFHPPL